MKWSPRPRRPLLLGFVFGLTLSLPFLFQVTRAEAQEQPLIVEGDLVTYDQGTQMVEASGNVLLRYRGIRLTADRVVFDLQREFLTADGRVVLIDPSGRELRGRALRYDLRLNLAEMEQAEAVVDRFYIRSETLQRRPGGIAATDAMLTPCPPARPLLRVTAQRVEITPGEELVASRASLWVGPYRVFTLPVYRISLRSGEATAQSFPRVGYNSTDGLWGQYVYGYALGTVRGGLLAKYGTRSGIIARNSLTYNWPGYSLDLTVGRNQDAESRIFDQAEILINQAEQEIGALPLFYTLELRSGWFEEAATGMRSSRTQYGFGLRVPLLQPAPRFSIQGNLSWSDAYYGSGARQGIARGNLGLRYELSSRESLSLSHQLLEIVGRTPFLFDAIDPGDLVNKTTVLYGRSGERGPVSTTFSSGIGYDFRGRSPLLIVGYGERVRERYHWGINAEYNLNTTDTALSVGVGHSVGTGTYATVQAVYHTLSKTFEDVDLVVTSRLCDCLEVSLVYRHIRQEIWLEIGLVTMPQSRLQFLFPGP